MVSPQLDPGIPIMVSGPYGGVHREVVLGAKEWSRRDASAVCGALMTGVFRWACMNGYLPDPRVVPWVLVPAPTTRQSSRQRGGDVVTRWCRTTAASVPGVVVVAPVLRSAGAKRDQVGLSAAARRDNVSGSVEINRREWCRYADWVHDVGDCRVVVVDDVVTTGSTYAESVLVLRAQGWRPAMGVALCRA
ncbi:ComF family protein [Corynebacterium kroppenstedtii]|uniref:ComF family protein n=1 Tax=Corynebacterium sp. PCR 32 TaxID=3351342 RepID=UPI00309D4BF8